MKRVVVLFLVLCMTVGLAAGCTATTANQTQAPTTQAPAVTEAATTEPTVSAEKPSIEIFINPWVGIPIEGKDPYKTWLDNLTNANWKLTYASDFVAELTTRAASNTMPDLIGFDDPKQMFDMYKQGILLEDWSSYKDTMPKTFENMGDTAKTYYSVDGKLICTTTLPGDQLWTLNIRKDWLAKLNLKMPTTPEELIAVAEAFTFKDPDGNGKDDTYGFTSAGANGIGEIVNLVNMYGTLKYYPTSDGKVSSYIVDGNLKKYLDFMKKIVSKKIIDPDWYTIGWDDRKPNLYSGKYGITWYPPEALIAETAVEAKNAAVKDWWQVLPMIDGSGNGTGGKLDAYSPYGTIRTVSATTGKSEIKMNAITKFLEATAVPNREYYIFRAGVDIDEFVMQEFEGRVYVDGAAAPNARKGAGEGQCLGLANYGKIINSASAIGAVVWGTTPKPDEATLASLTMSKQVMTLPRYDASAFLLNLNNDTVTESNTVLNEFMIKYILGENSDYDGFVANWLKSGGQATLDEAQQQFKSYKIIKYTAFERPAPAEMAGAGLSVWIVIWRMDSRSDSQ